MHYAQESIEAYIRAKDGNRPHMMSQAFAHDATVQMVVKAGSISFPPVSIGFESITDVLVRQFAQTYENIHTFCLAAPPWSDQVTFSCGWLVGMSEKQTRAVRVGCGQYDWLFQSQAPLLVERLTITIELMESLAPNSLIPVMDWFSRLPYPWCLPQIALANAPPLDGLEPIRHYVARGSA